MTVRLRAGWIGALQAILFLLAFASIGVAISLFLVLGYVALTAPTLQEGLLGLKMPGGLQTLVQGGAQLVGFLIATVVIGKWGLGWTFRDLRWTRGRPAVAGTLRGLALGAAAAAFALVSAVLLRAASWSIDEGGLADYVIQVTKTTAVLVPAALSEEVMFRGLPLVLLAGIMGRTPALLLVSGGIFSLLHAINPNITPLAFVNIAIAGLFIGVAFYAPGGIWTAFGTHLGWNATLAALDAPVSGLPFRIPLLDYHAGDPSWASGGSFGPEGGVLATIALVGALFVARSWSREERT